MVDQLVSLARLSVCCLFFPMTYVDVLIQLFISALEFKHTYKMSRVAQYSQEGAWDLYTFLNVVQ